MNLPDDIDKEVVELCNAINENFNPEIITVESCCGHRNQKFHVWFHLNEGGLERLPELLYWFDDCHSGRVGWMCETYTDCAMSPVIFLLRGPVGEQAYDDANHIASLIREAGQEG